MNKSETYDIFEFLHNKCGKIMKEREARNS